MLHHGTGKIVTLINLTAVNKCTLNISKLSQSRKMVTTDD